MRNFSKLGATALALALSLTMVAPVTANAYSERKKVKDGDNIYTEYSDSDTGKKFSTKDGGYVPSLSRIEEYLSPVVKTVTISTKSYGEEFELNTGADVKRFENFKSNKKNMKVKVTYRVVNTYTNPEIDYDAEDKDNYYYKDVNGDIQIVKKADVDKLPKNSEEGRCVIRLYAKKAGTYKLTYDAVLENGTTVKKTLKVIAKEDGNAIKSVTFAGQEIYYNSARMNDTAFTQKGNLNYTTKKSGKLKVTMNKDFKLKKIEIGTANLESKFFTYYEEDYEEEDEPIKYKSEDGTYIYSKTDDAGNDLDPKWKTVKNGKKIKLSKVNDNTGDQNVTTYNPDGSKSGTIFRDTKETTAITYIRITYYDKKAKVTKRERVEIEKLINK